MNREELRALVCVGCLLGVEKEGRNWVPGVEGREDNKAAGWVFKVGKKREGWDATAMNNGSRVIEQLSITLLV